MKQTQLTKGDLLAANRVLDNVAPTIQQFQRDATIAIHNGLISFEVCEDGGQYVPTEKFVEMMDRFNWEI